jgi:hypothetical protein
MSKRPRTEGGEDDNPAPSPSFVLTCEDLSCPICMNYFVEQIFQCSRGHLICPDCYRAMQSPTKACPSCREKMRVHPVMRNLALEEIASKQTFPCNGDGCDFVGKRDEMKEHKKTCVCTPIPCGVVGCKWKGKKSQIDRHCEEVHSDKEMVKEDGDGVFRIDCETMSDRDTKIIKYNGAYYFLCICFCERKDEDTNIYLLSFEESKIKYRMEFDDSDRQYTLTSRTISTKTQTEKNGKYTPTLIISDIQSDDELDMARWLTIRFLD